MPVTLQPKAIFDQQLIVIPLDVTIGCMTEADELSAFAARLNELCDAMDVPPKGKARQSAVAKEFGVSQNGARKWLEAEGYPALSMAKRIAIWAGVQVEWLLTGRGQKHLHDTTTTASAYSANQPAPLDYHLQPALSPGKRQLLNTVQQALANTAFDDKRARLVADMITTLLTPPKRND